MSEEAAMRELGDHIDWSTFEQILEMDEDDDREFSKGIVYGFFDQAETTFGKMDSNIDENNLSELSTLGHFLKGSSAIIGLKNIKESCEKIQHWGNLKDETGTYTKEDKECLRSIEQEVKEMRKEYKQCESGLKKFYGDA